VLLRWVELTANAKPAQYHEEQGGHGNLSVATHRVELHRLRELRRGGGFGPVGLELFHAGGCDLAIGDEGLPSCMARRP
jgi:hypothetical protein